MNIRFGRYTAVEELARGNMGVVVRAHDPDGREVAIKVLKTHRRDDPDDLKRFLAEARITAHLDHPHIVRHIESGDSEHGPYLVVELIEGRDLRAHVAERGPLEPLEAARLTRDIARALEHAHRAGVVHRDVKPDNILLDDHGRARLTDFGLGRLSDPFADRLTLSGDIIGTPVFMAPEQAQGKRAAVGPHADIYGLGGTLYFMLTGRPPAEGPTVEAVLLKVLQELPAAPSALGVDVAPELEAICLRCLAKDPSDRYLDAGALADDLDAFLDAPAPTPAAAPTPRGVPPAVWVVGLGLPLIAAAGAAAVILTSEPPTQPAEEPSAPAADAGPVAPAPPPPTPDDAALRELLARIDDALERRRPDLAKQRIAAAVRLAPDDPRPRLRAFRRHELLQDREASFAALRRAQALGGEQAVARALEQLYPDDEVLRRLAWVTFLPTAGGLEEAALLCSKLLFDRSLDVSVWLARLDALAAGLRPKLEGTRGPTRLRALVELVQRDIVQGDVATYTDPRNSRLELVLERKQGIHITCSLVVIALARRLGLRLNGLCFPGQFLARYAGPPPLFVNAFEARVMTEDDLREFFRRMTRGRAPYEPRFARPSTRQEIVVRLLHHLRNKLLQARDRRNARRAEQAVAALTPYHRDRVLKRAFGDH